MSTIEKCMARLIGVLAYALVYQWVLVAGFAFFSFVEWENLFPWFFRFGDWDVLGRMFYLLCWCPIIPICVAGGVTGLTTPEVNELTQAVLDDQGSE